MKIVTDFPLKKFNSFDLNVTAKKYIEINTIEDAEEFILDNRIKEQKLVIGEGSNILFTKDFYGIIIKVKIQGIHVVKEDEHYFWVKAGAGVIWHDLVESCIKANFGGIENLSLIPGTVGAAPIQNIGAYGVEIKDSFEALEAIHLETGNKKYFNKNECKFGYRDSIFKNELKDQYLITNVLLKLAKEPVINIQYGKISELLEESGINTPTIRDVSNAIIQIRQSKLPDPNKIGNAGSFFKNPIIPSKKLKVLQSTYPSIPSYSHSENDAKIPAAWLIDQCDFKGVTYKGAAVHTNQPLVLINKKNAKGTDILELSKKIQQKVSKEFGIKLEPEVRII